MPGRRTRRSPAAPRPRVRETTQRPASESYDSLATTAPPRIAYVLLTAVRSHDGVPRATDRHLVRPGRRHDPPVGVARYPPRALRRSLPRGRRRLLAGGDLRHAQRGGAGVLPAPLHRLGVRPRLVAHRAGAALRPRG